MVWGERVFVVTTERAERTGAERMGAERAGRVARSHSGLPLWAATFELQTIVF